MYAATQQKQHLAQAARDLKAITGEKMPWSDSLAALAQAGLYAAQNQEEQARATLEKARDAFDAQGMRLYAAAAGYLLALRQQDAPAMDKRDAELRHMVHAPERFLRLLAPGLAH